MNDDDQTPPSGQTIGPGFFSSAQALSRPADTPVTPAPDPASTPTEGGGTAEFSSPGIANYSGRVVGGYKLLEVIGQGGMGQVYLAEHVRLGRRVALKMLRPEYAFDTDAVKRFFGEARAVNQISHDHIIEITDFIEGKGQPASYIMEYLEGESLAGTLASVPRVPAERLCHIGIQVASAMAAVHDAFMIHRDLKPDNIFLTTREGTTDYVKLLDFGVAKLTEKSDLALGEVATTQAGVILGTPEYMAPEQFEAKELDHRTDIYALGVILYEMATGRKPFVENSIGRLAVATLTKIPTRPLALADPPNIPYALDALITQCLEKSPDRRPQHMAAIEERLSTILQEMQAGTAQYGTLEALAPDVGDLDRPARGRGLAIAAGLGALVCVGAAITYFALGQTAGPPPAAPVVTAPAPDPTPPPRTPTTLSVAVVSAPVGATVFIDGEEKGTTPYQGTLPATDQPHDLLLKKAGHHDVQQRFAAGEPLLASVTLEPVASKKPAPRRKTSSKKVRRTDRAPAKADPKAPRDTTRTPRTRPKRKSRKSLLDPFAQ